MEPVDFGRVDAGTRSVEHVRPSVILGDSVSVEQWETKPPAFPVPRECPFEPPEIYQEWRSTCPAAEVTLPNGSNAWVLTRNEDVRRVLGSDKVTTKPGKAKLRAGVVMPPGEDTNLLYLDNPKHGHYRKMLVKEFTPKHIQSMRPGIEKIVNQCIDSLLEQDAPADFVRTFCLPIPSMVICQLLGVPYTKHEYFERLASKLTDIATPPEEYQSTLTELTSYMDQVVAEKEGNPTDDIIGRLIDSRIRTGELTHAQLVGFAMLLLIAGYETTANQIAMGVLNLLTDRDRLEEVRQDPELWSSVIEEMLRIASISDKVPMRTALDDIEVGGRTIAAGDGVIALLGAANHDPAVFENPDLFDPDRNNRASVAFGFGIHTCVGQNLARAELDVAFRLLFERIPTLELHTPLDRIRFKQYQHVFGPEEFEVRW
ncbi:cytochrome P450 [Nocardia rhamnosiphila]|uniref:Cytochrome P450 n=1 Tax=Nocardia rhamnosiphila TaxID=426716 RepID=A0ABV2X0M4_9NOCA